MVTAFKTRRNIRNLVVFSLIIGTVLWGFSFGSVSAETVHAKAKKELTERIQNLLSEIQELQKKLAVTPEPGAVSVKGDCTFKRDLFLGLSGDDVSCLQGYLFKTGHVTQKENITGYFGPITREAMINWQTDNNVEPALGYFGPISRSVYLKVPNFFGGEESPPEIVATGSKLTVVSGLRGEGITAPISAARIPLLKVVFAAGADGSVLVKSLRVSGKNLNTLSALESLSLLDEDNNVVGAPRAFDGNLEAVFNEPFLVRAGEIRIMTISGNRASHATGAGETIRVSLTHVDAGNAEVEGLLPIGGAEVTINTFLSIGRMSVGRGPLDPGGDKIKNPGIKNQVFSSLQVRADGGEDLVLESIRWYQSGVIKASDFENLRVEMAGEKYSVNKLSGSQYYFADLKDFVLSEGEVISVSILGDIIGGAGGSVTFDILDPVDLRIGGRRFGYGIVPPRQGAGLSRGTPWYDASTVNISEGVMVIKESVQSLEDVAIGVANQILGGFDISVYGEPVVFEKVKFRIKEDENIRASLISQSITNVVLEGPEGIVAGPVDQSGADIIFSGPVTFPVGGGPYFIKGTVLSDFGSNKNITLLVKPQTDWERGIGSLTEASIIPESGEILESDTVTVRSATLALSVDASGIVSQARFDVRNLKLAEYQFDAANSGEDIRVKSFSAQLSASLGSSQSLLRNCKLLSDETLLNTGENVVYPKDATEESFYTFFLDTNLVVPKGKKVTVDLVCDVTSSRGNQVSFSWGLPESTKVLVNALGVVSGEEVSVKTGETAGAEVLITPF